MEVYNAGRVKELESHPQDGHDADCIDSNAALDPLKASVISNRDGQCPVKITEQEKTHLLAPGVRIRDQTRYPPFSCWLHLREPLRCCDWQYVLCTGSLANDWQPTKSDASKFSSVRVKQARKEATRRAIQFPGTISIPKTQLELMRFCSKTFPSRLGDEVLSCFPRNRSTRVN